KRAATSFSVPRKSPGLRRSPNSSSRICATTCEARDAERPARKIFFATSLPTIMSKMISLTPRRLKGRDRPAALFPEPFGGQRRSGCERLELQPRNLAVHLADAGEGAEAAVRAGHDALAADDIGEHAQALSDELRVLDIIRGGREETGNEN